MSKADKISYSKRDGEITLYPDNPNYVWSDGQKNSDMTKIQIRKKWFNKLKEQYESFEHDKQSSLYRVYGRDYDDESQRVMTMPNGVVESGNENYMADDLKRAIKHRVESWNDDSLAGWKVFENVEGWYDVEAADEETTLERNNMLRRFLDIIQEDDYLTIYDPLTNKEAVTTVGADGLMKPIEYMFPMGADDTDFLHYVVMEPKVVSVEIDSEEQVKTLVREAWIYNYLQDEDMSISKKSLGLVMRRHGKYLRPYINMVQEQIYIIEDMIYGEAADFDIYEENDRLAKMVEEMLSVAEVDESKLVETYKKIGVSSFLKKIKNKELLKRLERIRPPEKGKAAGVRWPQSKGGEYALWITTDPFEMLTKSTGRVWSERNKSCENWDGCYARGPASDVEFGNAVVWVYRKGQEEYRNEIGRFLLRWGNSYKAAELQGIDIGVEIQVYPKDPRQSPWGYTLLGAIGMILKDAGYLNYDECKTPYRFMGYSDKASEGKCKITYDSKIWLKGQGEVEVGDANALVTMANSETLSYADSGYIITYGNQAALMALAQNPMIWIYENSARRLINRALDEENGGQIIRFMVESEVCNFDFMAGLIENLSYFDDAYLSAIERNGLIQAILRHSKCNDETHIEVLNQHPGFESGGEIIGGVEEFVYLGLADQNSNLVGDGATPPLMTTAPPQILNKMVEDLIKNRYNNDILFDLCIANGAAGRIGDYNRMSDKQKRLYKKHRNFLAGCKNLMFSPKLPLQSFAKLLTAYAQLWKKHEKGYVKYKKQRNGGEGNIDLFYESLNTIRKYFAIAVCAPLESPDDWGYINRFEGFYVGLDTVPSPMREIIMEDRNGQTMKLPIQKKQSWGTIQRIAYIMPCLIKYKLIDGYNNYDEEGFTGLWQGLLLKNIRDLKSFNLLQDRKDIHPIAFISRVMDRKSISESSPNRFLNKEIFTKAIAEMSARYPQDYKYLAYDYDYASRNPRLREEFNESVMGLIVNNPQIIQDIGANYVALWIRYENHFRNFVDTIFSIALGNYYNQGYIIAPKPMGERDWLYFIDEVQQIDILNLASCGGNTFQGGLVRNTYLPSELQMALLGIGIDETDLMEGSLETLGGFNKQYEDYEYYSWTFISNLFDGNYENYLMLVMAELSTNLNVSADAVQYLVDAELDEGMKNTIMDNIIKNSRVRLTNEIIEDKVKQNPLPLLKNPNIERMAYKSLINDWIAMLKKNPPSELERLSKGVDDYRIERKWGRPNYNNWNEVLYNIRRFLDDNNWIRYWRGGNWKKAMELPRDSNDAPINPETDRPMALVDSPKFILNQPQIVLKTDLSEIDDEDEDETYWKQSDATLYSIKSINEGENGVYTFEGTYYTENEGRQPIQFSTTDLNDFYGFIDPEERNDDKKWRNSVILVFYDAVNPEDVEELPQWRMESNEVQLKETLEDICKQTKLTDNDMIQISKTFQNPFQVLGMNGWYDATLFKYLTAVDKEKRWSVDLINTYKREIFTRNGWYQQGWVNLKPTEELFNLSLETDEEVLSRKLGIRTRHLDALQIWILNFEDILPIQYIYEILISPVAQAYVKDRAKVIRSKRIQEFLDLLRRDENPEVNDAEELLPNNWNYYGAEESPNLINVLKNNDNIYSLEETIIYMNRGGQ